MVEQKEGNKKRLFFPSTMERVMVKVDPKIQYEASMIAICVMLFGIVLSGVYIWIKMDYAWWFKIVTEINILAGFVLLGSFLITTFQAYKSYCDAQAFQQAYANTTSHINKLKGGKI